MDSPGTFVCEPFHLVKMGKKGRGKAKKGSDKDKEDHAEGFISLAAPAEPAAPKKSKPKQAGGISVNRPKLRGVRGQCTKKQKLRKNDRLQKAMAVSDKKGQRISKSSSSSHRKQQLKHLWTNQPELQATSA